MATIFTLPSGLNRMPTRVPLPVDEEQITSDFVFDLANDNAGAALNDNDAIEAMWLPPNCVLIPTGCYLASDELDEHATPTALLNVGVSIAGTLDEDAIMVGFTTGATFQQQVGPTNAGGAFHDIGYSASSRKIIITVDQDPATDSTTGTIYLSVAYRNMRQGDALTD